MLSKLKEKMTEVFEIIVYDIDDIEKMQWFLFDNFRIENSLYPPFYITRKGGFSEYKIKHADGFFMYDFSINIDINNNRVQVSTIDLIECPLGVDIIFRYDIEIDKNILGFFKILKKRLDILGYKYKELDQRELKGNQEIQSESSNPIEFLENHSQEAKKIFKGFSLKTGQEILDRLPDAYEYHMRTGERWGPAVISKFISLHPTTIGRYLKVFRSLNIQEYKNIKLPISLKK